jgi:hypothetical protein
LYGTFYKKHFFSYSCTYRTTFRFSLLTVVLHAFSFSLFSWVNTTTTATKQTQQQNTTTKPNNDNNNNNKIALDVTTKLAIVHPTVATGSHIIDYRFVNDNNKKKNTNNTNTPPNLIIQSAKITDSSSSSYRRQGAPARTRLDRVRLSTPS